MDLPPPIGHAMTEVLACPRCRAGFRPLAGAVEGRPDARGRIELVVECTACAARYPIVNGVLDCLAPEETELRARAGDAGD